MSTVVTKLNEGDPGYNADIDKYNVVETSSSSISQSNVMTLEDIDATLAQLNLLKEQQITRYDAMISKYQALRNQMLPDNGG